MAIRRVCAEVISQKSIGTGIFDMVLSVGEIAKDAVPGQFVAVYSNNGSKLLPRPISICGIDKEKETLRIVYRVTGEGTGTEEFSGYGPGTKVYVMGPLGNGYTLKDKKAIVIGGGIGIPPMLELAKQLDCEKTVVLGYRDETFLDEEFAEVAPVYMSSDFGTVGVKGTVIDAIKEYGVEGDIIYACGPMPMLRALKAYAEENNMEAFISLEERMACGVGACLGCVVKTKEVDHHTHVNNTRICTEGPVFDAREVEI